MSKQVLVLFAALCLASCNSESPQTSDTNSASQPAASAPAGNAEQIDSLRVVFQKQKNPEELEASTKKVGDKLSEALDIPVEVFVPTSYAASVQSLISGTADVAYVSSIPYLMADAEVDLEILLVEVRDNRTDYDSIFVVSKDSPYESLEDVRGKRMMFTSTTSTSGYVMAYSRLVNDGLLEAGEDPEQFFESIAYAGGYDRALLSVVNGQADVCAVSYYTMEGPKADLYLNEEDRSKLRVLTRTPGVPTHLLCVRASLPEETKTKIRETLLQITESDSDLLADVYGAATFVEATEEDHLEAARQAMINTGLAPAELVK